MDIQEIQKIIPKDKIFINEPMKNHTSLKIGGPAEYFIKIENEEQLKEIIKNIKDEPLTIMGNGSNILVTDKGIKGIVLKIEIKKLEIEQKDDKFIVSKEVTTFVLMSWLF